MDFMFVSAVYIIYTYSTNQNNLFTCGKPLHACAPKRCLALCALATLSFLIYSAIILCVICIDASVVITGLMGCGTVDFCPSNLGGCPSKGLGCSGCPSKGYGCVSGSGVISGGVSCFLLLYRISYGRI